MHPAATAAGQSPCDSGLQLSVDCTQPVDLLHKGWRLVEEINKLCAANAQLQDQIKG